MTCHIVCRDCGSTEITADAAASWDAKTQAWVLAAVYDDRFCEGCGEKPDLIEVDEAEGLEIQVSGMIADGANSFRLVDDHETPTFFDVMVRTTSLEGGEIISLHEFDDLPRVEADNKLAEMLALYPTAGVSCFYGAEG